MEAATLVGRVGRALDRLAARARHSSSLVALLPGDHGKLHRLPVTD